MSLKDSLDNLPSVSPQESVKIEDKGDTREVTIVSGERIETQEQATDKAQVDLAVWEVDRLVIESREAHNKLAGDRIAVTPLFNIKLFLKRKLSREIQEGIELLMSRVKRVKKKPSSRKRNKADYLAELSVYDAHFGNLAFKGEFDLDQQAERFVGGVRALLNNLSGRGVSEIVFPVGHDLMHFDGWKKQTTKGTQLEALSESLPKVFEVAELSVRESIMASLNHAPVHVVLVPGNHDHTTSYFLCKVLEARFHDVKEVTFDLGEESRKYRTFGNTLFGYTHGDDTNLKDLPLLMAAEAPTMWGESAFRCWRTGHQHRKKQISFMAGDEHKGVRVDVMPSLTQTDAWHHKMGFVANCKAAELWITHKTTGYKGHFSENVL